MDVELIADAPSASNFEHELSQLQIILDIWPPSCWITGARHDSQPQTIRMLSASYVHGNRFRVYEGVHNWHFFNHV